MRKGLATAGVVALIATGAAACGTEEPSSPQGKVKNAFTKLGRQKSASLEASLSGSADEIYAALKGEDDFHRSDAKTLAALHVTAGVSADRPLAEVVKANGKGGSYGLRLTGDDAGKKALLEFRTVGGKHYIRVDLKALIALDPTQKGELGELNGFLDGAGKLPSSFGSVKALATGGWVQVDPAAFADLARKFGGADSPLSGLSGGADDSGSGAAKGADPAAPWRLLDALGTTIAKDGKVTDLGQRDGADHLKVTVPAQRFATDLSAGLGSLAKELPAPLREGLNRAPNKTVSFDLALKGGKVSHLTVDLAQFDTSAKGALPLDLAVNGDAAPVSAPAGAKVLNPQDLIGLALQQFGGDSSDSDSGSGWSSGSSDSGSDSGTAGLNSVKDLGIDLSGLSG